MVKNCQNFLMGGLWSWEQFPSFTMWLRKRQAELSRAALKFSFNSWSNALCQNISVWVRKILGLRFFGTNKIVGPRFFWVQTNFGVKSSEHFRSENILGLQKRQKDDHPLPCDPCILWLMITLYQLMMDHPVYEVVRSFSWKSFTLWP